MRVQEISPGLMSAVSIMLGAVMLRVSPDGKRVLSYGGGLVAESELATGKPRVEFERHAGSVEGVGFLPNGKQVVSGCSDGTLRVWDVTSGETELVIEGANLGAYSLAVSPDGAKLYAAGDSAIIGCWDLKTAEKVRELKGPSSRINALAVSLDGKLLTSASADTTLLVWALE